MAKPLFNLALTGDWQKARAILPTLHPEATAAFAKAVLQEAHFLRAKILEAFKRGGPEGDPWRPHSPITVAMRQLLGNSKSKLLIQSGDLRASVGVIPIPGGGAFVGVRRSAASSSRLGAVNLGEMMELGATFHVTMTPKQRRLLFAAIHRAGLDRPRSPGPRAPGSDAGTTVTIRIPPRPFLGPIFARYCQPADLESSIMSRVAKLLEGKIGQASGTPRE